MLHLHAETWRFGYTGAYGFFKTRLLRNQTLFTNGSTPDLSGNLPCQTQLRPHQVHCHVFPAS